MQTAALAGEYLTYCKYLGLAEKTIKQYRWALNRLIKHCSELPNDGFDLLPVIGDDSLGATSRRDLLKCLKSFFGWAQRRHKWPNPCVGLTLPRQRNQTRRVLTKNEIDRLFSVATSIRDRTLLLLLLLDCGLRVAEVANLRRGDLRDGWLTVTGKTGERLLLVSGELANLLTTLGEGTACGLGGKEH